ncbi:hypothetical protein ACLESO_24665 [Pyxidicoccus sp. 3LG]
MKALEKELRAGEEFRIIEGLSENPSGTEAAGGLEQQRRMVFLVRIDDLPHTCLRPVPGKNLYRVDSITSPAIEFSPCVHIGSQMRPGRFFFETRYYKGEKLLEKHGEFLAWSNWVVSKCRKALESDRATSTLWGEEAARLRESSQLTFLPR